MVSGGEGSTVVSTGPLPKTAEYAHAFAAAACVRILKQNDEASLVQT